MIHRHFLFSHRLFLLSSRCVDFILLSLIRVLLTLPTSFLLNQSRNLDTRALVQGYHVGFIVQYLFLQCMTNLKEKERKKPPSLWSNAPFTPCPQLCMKNSSKSKNAYSFDPRQRRVLSKVDGGVIVGLARGTPGVIARSRTVVAETATTTTHHTDIVPVRLCLLDNRVL